MSREDLNLATAETAPFSATDGHRDLHALVGEWEGTTRTWLDPSARPDEGHTTARIEAVLGGRFVRLEYRGTVIGKPHAGEMLLGCDTDGRLAAAWIDSFHMATGIMMSTGERRADGAVSVLGSYDAGGQQWGWRTVLRADGGGLAIDTTNIAPDGVEHPATESRLVPRR
jgi:Protein of unknown function (DUF1579)